MYIYERPSEEDIQNNVYKPIAVIPGISSTHYMFTVLFSFYSYKYFLLDTR